MDEVREEYVAYIKEITERRLRDCVNSPYSASFSVQLTPTEPGSEVAQKYGFEKPRDEEYEAFCQWDQEEPE